MIIIHLKNINIVLLLFTYNNQDQINLQMQNLGSEILDPEKQGNSHYKVQNYEQQPTLFLLLSISENPELYYKQIKLNQNFFSKEELENQPNFTMIKGRNYFYFGGIVQKFKHGFGILITNKSIYQGSFKLDLKNGKGYQKFQNNSIYEGDFLNNKPHGHGKFIYPTKQVYTGQFQNGAIHGNGMWISVKGDKYIGQWKNNKADGNGIHVWVNGDKYQGQFKQFLKHGYGIQTFTNGDIYKGNYQAGKPNGYGQYYWSNKSQFRGQFRSGLRHGKGIWKRNNKQNSDSFQGFYENDKKSGYGTYFWASGNIYKGQFFNDLRHGQGQMIWNDGSYYIGNWQQGVQHGLGKVCIVGTKQRYGLFENNMLLKQLTKNEFEKRYKQNIQKSRQNSNQFRSKSVMIEFKNEKTKELGLITESSRLSKANSQLKNNRQYLKSQSRVINLNNKQKLDKRVNLQPESGNTQKIYRKNNSYRNRYKNRFPHLS